MSDWDSNPFQDSSSSSNPFADPSVAAYTSRQSTITNGNSPFDTPEPKAIRPPPPAVPESTLTKKTQNSFAASYVPPASSISYSSSATASSKYDTSKYDASSSFGDKTDIVAREAALRERELSLDKREKDLIEREKSMEEAGFKPKNWPAFPKWCFFPFKPWIHHDIDNEIPNTYKTIVRRMFKDWFFTAFIWVINCIACFSALVGCKGCTDTGTNFGLSLVFMLLFVPASFACWYRVLYNGLQKDKTANFFLFFFVYGFQVAVNIFNSIGIPSTGGAGWIVAIDAMGENNVVAGIFVITAALWTLNAIVSVLLFKNVHAIYRSTGKTSDDAKREVISSAAKNKTVQDGVKDSILNNAV